jgi:hypothetical protein
MITKESFFTEFNGHSNAYSSYMLIGVTPEQVIDMLNARGYDWDVGSGEYDEANKTVSFEICKEGPDKICDFTADLHCNGFADMGSWYGEPEFCYARNGVESDEYYAYWKDGQAPEPYSDSGAEEDALEDGEEVEQLWDVDVIFVDPESGASYLFGEGALSTDIKERFEEMVNSHPCPPDIKR